MRALAATYCGGGARQQQESLRLQRSVASLRADLRERLLCLEREFVSKAELLANRNPTPSPTPTPTPTPTKAELLAGNLSAAVLPKLMAALDEYSAGANRGVMIEYILIKDVNDGLGEAAALRELLLPRHKAVVINLIPYNQTAAGDRYGYSGTIDSWRPTELPGLVSPLGQRAPADAIVYLDYGGAALPRQPAVALRRSRCQYNDEKTRACLECFHEYSLFEHQG